MIPVQPPGVFISIEGPDGSGKSSVIRELSQLLEATGQELVLTREPGGSPIAERIREVILDVDHVQMDAKTEALLFAASRRQHLVETILPAVAAGKIVISDRFVDSSLAYQGVARQIPMEEIWRINAFAIEDHMPELTLLIDVPAEVGLERIYQAQGKRQFDRLDREDIAFHHRVREAFLQLAEGNERFALIDGSQSITDVAQQCYQVMLERKIIMRG